jgi:hypothetical protein
MLVIEASALAALLMPESGSEEVEKALTSSPP